jgi:glycosyltransferase involved in cell wall biosynthesis
MRIAYFMPLKPIGHNHPSGDLIIGTDLFQFIQSRRIDILPASRFRARWIYLKPWLWPVYLIHSFWVMIRIRRRRPDLWLTYHSYYKAPDILGPICARWAKIPYVIFQGIYSTKRRRKALTWAGFMLNRKALMAADLVLTNKKKDFTNLQRIIPPDRLAYVRPGIVCRDFRFDSASRRHMRLQWECNHRPVVISAAMFRPGVKTEGLELVIRACSILRRRGLDLRLVLVGDGDTRQRLESLANRLMPDRVRFEGQVRREDLYQYYSAADVFVFPGIDESLGMVYLEAQSCGLPAVAFGDWGAKEAIVTGKTGYLSASNDFPAFVNNIRFLIENEDAREAMGKAAAAHIREHHDLHANYMSVERMLNNIAARTDFSSAADLN